MIGLGKWGCKISSMFFSGEVAFTISDKDGKYDFSLDVKGVSMPQYVIKSIEEDGDTLTVIASVPMVGKDVEVSLTFDGDSFDGVARVPFAGKMKLKNGYRIA